MHEVQCHLIRHVHEQRWRSRGRVAARNGSAVLQHGETLVGRGIANDGYPPVRPFDGHGIDGLDPAQTEREHVVDARLEAARGHQLLVEHRVAAAQGNLRAHAESVGAGSLELHLQPAVPRQERARVIAVDRGRFVDVVHDEIERSVTIEIAVRGAVRGAGRIQTPVAAAIGKRQIALVPERVVGQRRGGHFPNEPQEVHLAVADRGHERSVARQIGKVILSREVAGHAVGDVDVLAAVEVEIRDQRAPAPVGPGHARELADLRKRAIAVAQVQHVARELVVVSVLQFRAGLVPALER